MPANDVETVADGKHIRLVRRGRWEYVTRKSVSGIVGIIAVTDDGKLLLVEQDRPPVNGSVIEIPAGLAGDIAGHETEALATAAERELLEETGYQATAMEYLTQGTASAGITDEVITLFRATGITRMGPAAGDGGEQITVHEIPLAGIDAWLDAQRQAGKKIDLKVYAGLYFAKRG